MRHDFIHIIIVALLCSACFGGCRSKKDVQKNSETIGRYERIERVVDTTRTVGTEELKADRRGSEIDQSYIRVTEFDSTGTVRRIQETWRDRQRSDVATEERNTRTVSVVGESKEVIESDTSSTIVSEVVKVDTDSRPVQGIEWMWVVLSGALIVAVILYIIYNRVK